MQRIWFSSQETISKDCSVIVFATIGAFVWLPPVAESAPSNASQWVLINNIALYYLYDQKKQNNHFTLSILFSIMLLLAYIVATIFALSNCVNCGIKSAATIFIISIVTSCISVYMYSKNAKASFNIKNDESAKISEERKDKSKTLEDRIKSDD